MEAVFVQAWKRDWHEERRRSYVGKRVFLILMLAGSDQEEDAIWRFHVDFWDLVVEDGGWNEEQVVFCFQSCIWDNNDKQGTKEPCIEGTFDDKNYIHYKFHIYD